MRSSVNTAFQINAAFAVPFVVAHHPDCAGLNRELLGLFLQREAASAQYRNEKPTMKIHPSLYESRFDLFKWPESCVQRLREFCWSTLYRAVGELNGYDVEMLRRLRGNADAWFHITRPGGYFGLHNHAMASWSGVYCVTPGRGHEPHPESGLLSFPHPNGIASMFVDMGMYKLKPPFGFGPKQFRLVPGQLVLFPSWLLHQILPYQGEDVRVTVAFNAWFQLLDEAPPTIATNNP